jgi:hypothetical protein
MTSEWQRASMYSTCELNMVIFVDISRGLAFSFSQRFINWERVLLCLWGHRDVENTLYPENFKRNRLDTVSLVWVKLTVVFSSFASISLSLPDNRFVIKCICSGKSCGSYTPLQSTCSSSCPPTRIQLALCVETPAATTTNAGMS